MEEVQPEVVAVSLRLSQSKPVYEAFQSLKEGSAWSQLTEAQQRIVDKNLREFTLGGVALEVGTLSLPCWHHCILAGILRYKWGSGQDAVIWQESVHLHFELGICIG